MSKNLSAVRAIVRQFILDEFTEGIDLTWEDDELDLHIGHCLSEISKGSPYEKRETLTTTASSKELDISSIEDFLELDPEHEIEYPTGSDPPDYHNASIFGNTLRMNIDRVPSADENVYLYCLKLHSLTESSSTLKPQQERLLIDGVCAYAAISKSRVLINKVNIGGGRTPAGMLAWGQNKLAIFKAELSRVKPRTTREYPKS